MASTAGKRTRAAAKSKRSASRSTPNRSRNQNAARSRSRSVRPSGKKKQRRDGHGFRIFWLLVLVLVLVYAGFCAKAYWTDTIYPNTKAMGADLGGMTREEAASLLSQTVSQQYAAQSLTVQVGESVIPVSLSGLVEIDSAGAVQEILSAQHGNVLAGGAWYLKALILGNQTELSPYISFVNLEQVYSVLQEQLTGLGSAVVETSYQLTDTQLIITKGVSGQTIDQEKLQADILAALEQGELENPIICQLTVTTPQELNLEEIYQSVYQEPVSAYCDENANVVADVQGVSFDVTEAQSQLAAAAEGSTVAVNLTLADAEVTAQQLEAMLFRDVLGTCTTNVGGSSARISNVKLAASFVDGTVLNPGQRFSYNDTVGQRTEARGFQAAPAYSGGETVQEVGGGICQVSSTIYLATLRSNLKIVERRNHSYVCSYMPNGEDATVSWGGPDFVFENDTEYPIRIAVSYGGGTLTATIYGTNLTGQYVEVTNEVTSTTSYQTIYQDTTELAAGETKTKTSGYNGMTVKVYRNVYAADGTLISSNLESDNTYRVRDKVVLRGVAQAEPTEPEPVASEPAEESPAVSESPAEESATAGESATEQSTDTE